MNFNSKEIDLIGHLSLELLFTGSKCEGTYPVLHGVDGVSYRLHVKGELTFVETSLAGLVGNRIRVRGRVDDIRGHLRLVLDRDDPKMIEVLTSNSPEKAELTLKEGISNHAGQLLERTDKTVPNTIELTDKDIPDSTSCNVEIKSGIGIDRDLRE